MADDIDRYADWSLPALLRVARRTYGSAIGQALAELEFGDLPRNGAFVVGGIARSGAPLSEIIEHLGVSKQAAGQLVDTLVTRGYLDRAVDDRDRRRLTVTLTERGRDAAAAIRSAVDRVDARLLEKVGDRSVAHTRAALVALIEIDGERRGRHGDSN
ncbi:MAG: MarR family transcriptional regulator [Acidimicrobiales bacterium]